MFSEAEKMELILIVTRHLEISDQRKKKKDEQEPPAWNHVYNAEECGMGIRISSYPLPKDTVG
jgi:hypothetical protein